MDQRRRNSGVSQKRGKRNIILAIDDLNKKAMNKKLIEEFKLDIISLKTRIKRLEDFILEMPKPEEYVHPSSDLDELFTEALKIIKEYDYVSASLLQRRLAIGYSRAARLLDQLEVKGYVGKAEGGKPRKVLKKI